MSSECNIKYVTSNQQWQWSYELAKRIDMSGWCPDVIVGLYRGGVFTSIMIEDYLRSKHKKTMHFPLVCKSYDEDAAESTSVDVEVKLSKDVIDEIRNLQAVKKSYLNVLIVDDICDTGKTFKAVANKLLDVLNNLSLNIIKMRIACLFWKPGKSDIFPTWWIKEAKDNDWIVFPHEFCGIDLKAKLYHEEKDNNNGHREEH